MLEKIKFSYVVSENQTDLCTQYHERYDCKIKHNKKQYTFEYQCNPNADMKPNVKDCIECLTLDMSAFEDSTDVFDFALNFGYSDDDLKRAKRDYKACEKTAKAMHRLFTDEELGMIYDELNES